MPLFPTLTKSSSKVDTMKEVKIDIPRSPSPNPTKTTPTAGPSSAAKGKGKLEPDDKAKKVQGQVNEVIGIMQGNIDKVVTRGEKINTLKDKTEALATGTMNFKKGSKSLKQKAWCMACRCQMIIFAVTISIILIVGLGLYMYFSASVPRLR